MSMKGINVPDPGCISHAQLVRRMDKDYGWVNTDKLLRTSQYIAVVHDLDYNRIRNFAELWFLLHGYTPPTIDQVFQFMDERPTLFMNGIGFASEVYSEELEKIRKAADR